MSQAQYVEEYGVANPSQVTPRVVQGHNPRLISQEEPPIPRFSGLDVAKRVDHSAFELLRMDTDLKTGERSLREEAFMLWPHVNYRKVSSDIFKIYTKYPWEMMGFDRAGVGDAAQEFFDVTGLRMEPLKTTDTLKVEIVSIVRGLFNSKKLFVGNESELVRQIEEQELIKTDAGNIRYKHPSNRHDDRFWALGYACYVALPYVLNMPPPMIRRIGTQQDERDIDAEIDKLMGFDSSIMSY